MRQLFMAGHSKWKSIKHKKGINDVKKAKLYSKFSREIMTIAKNGKNPLSNYHLKVIISIAKSNGVPNDVIDKAINSADKPIIGENVQYEAFLPNRIALIIEGFTENKTRTFTEIRTIINKNGGNLSSCEYLFNKIGIIEVEAKMEDIIEIEGISDVEEHDKSIVLYTDPKDLNLVVEKLKNFNIINSEIIFIPLEPVESNDESYLKVIDLLEEINDITNVFTNVK